MNKIIYIIVLSLILFSCKNEDEINDKIVAQVGDKYLLATDLDMLISNTGKDSSMVSQEIIDDWIVKQLEYQEAIKNIGENNKEIQYLVDDYKIFLYVDRYKNEYVKTKLDTIVSKNEINEFYEKNKDLYILKDNLVKATYIKAPIKAPKLYKLNSWLKSDKLEDQEQLSAYCVQYADKYDDFDNNWVKFDDIIKNVPKKISKPSSFLKYTKRIEVRDSASYYLVYIRDYKLVNDTSPVDFVKEEVAKSIIKQRKKDLLITLKNNILSKQVKQTK